MDAKFPVMSKADIHNLVEKIISVLKKKYLLDDCSFYYNNRRVSYREDRVDWKKGEINYKVEVMKNVSPFDYFDYAATKHILSITTALKCAGMK